MNSFFCDVQTILFLNLFVDQFRSLAAVTSLAWHVRLEKLHLKNGDELNKMQSNMKKLYAKAWKTKNFVSLNI